MKTYEIEAWALQAIERVERKQPNEDSRIELKREWPDGPAKAARQIAGHANAQRGEPILWLIGVDEKDGVVGAEDEELSNWWLQIKAQFDGPLPQLQNVLVSSNGITVVALYFETAQLPFVVKNPKEGPVDFEVPWREGNSTRTAKHADLIRILVPLLRPILKIEIGVDGRHLVERTVLTNTGTSLGTIKTHVRFLRVKVVNDGRETAKNCVVFLTNVEIWRGDTFCKTDYKDDLKLVWSHHPGTTEMDIMPKAPYWLDVVSTQENHQGFFLESHPKPRDYHGLIRESSYYRLSLSAFAECAEPTSVHLHLRWGGIWNSLRPLTNEEWESKRKEMLDANK